MNLQNYSEMFAIEHEGGVKSRMNLQNYSEMFAIEHEGGKLANKGISILPVEDEAIVVLPTAELIVEHEVPRLIFVVVGHCLDQLFSC
ncbi:hypothetical protein TNIN_485721 [Trichonephila inaurata madagascariensis]|uniref:Uncharacterized protein n=1 Tax=Trichonephila inaurata madagascariensis TaxID=2747483 RepID=A0A8X6WV98_9ARAC|nr:hypothetical protein TNIN_485721 [Trichonephila inaurata madagascariensis]